MFTPSIHHPLNVAAGGPAASCPGAATEEGDTGLP